jgi:hypothetical protein
MIEVLGTHVCVKLQHPTDVREQSSRFAKRVRIGSKSVNQFEGMGLDFRSAAGEGCPSDDENGRMPSRLYPKNTDETDFLRSWRGLKAEDRDTRQCSECSNSIVSKLCCIRLNEREF